MTEKRFEFREVNITAIVPKVYDTKKQQYANLFECVHWLNDLHEENEELKKILEFLRNDNATDILNVLNSQENQIWELKEENEQLKNQNELLSDELEQCKAVIDNKWGEYLKKKERQEHD